MVKVIRKGRIITTGGIFCMDVIKSRRHLLQPERSMLQQSRPKGMGDFSWDRRRGLKKTK